MNIKITFHPTWSPFVHVLSGPVILQAKSNENVPPTHSSQVQNSNLPLTHWLRARKLIILDLLTFLSFAALLLHSLLLHMATNFM